jgi:2-isopropylmalate synthase
MAAVAVGGRHVQAPINGYGERCGNANMVSILANLALKTEHALVPAGGGDLTDLTTLSRSVAEIANVAPNDFAPYVGRSAFAHKGGVHGAAVAKVERSYQHVDPTAVGNEGRLVVSELGGRANTEIRARQLGLSSRGGRPGAVQAVKE